MAVRSLREKLWVNGFHPVAVLNGDKRPAGKEWPERARMNPPETVTEWPDNSALSTGILTDGLVAVDIDIDDSVLMETVLSAAIHFLGDAPKRTRSNSARCLLLYRAVEGEPSKRTLNGSLGKIEALGRGQQFVAFGFHPSGSAYEWSPCAPETFNRSRLPSVSQDALTAFLGAIAPYIGAEVPTPPLAAPPDPSIVSPAPSVRDIGYAARALEDTVTTLRALRPGDGRNAALNTAAHSLGTLVGNGSIDAALVGHALLDASEANGHSAKHGQTQSKKTIESGMNAGIKKPRPLLSDGDLPAIDLSGLLPKDKPANKVSQKPSGKRSITLLQGTQIEEEPVSWLWDGYLPLGKLTLLAGAGGTGKSTLAFSIAATITNGGLWPDGSRCTLPGNVLIWSSEDDPADTIKPRLMAVGAEPTRYGVISGVVNENGERDSFDAARDMGALRDAVTQIGGISLLVIDPIVTAVTGDMHKANDVRRSLQTIVDFAAECNCAVLGITHFAKGTAGKNSAERVIGSQAFAALSRMVLVAAKEEESDRRVFTRAKSNNSIDSGGFSYAIEAVLLHRGIIATRVVWGEVLEGSSRSILEGVENDEANSDSSQRGRARQFLSKQLANGPSPSKELLEHAKEALGISADTMRRAKDELGIVARKSGLGGWMWELPTPATVPVFLR